MTHAITDVITEPEPAIEHSEAFETLLARVGRKSPRIPADVLVRHVMRCVPPEEWPARVEAMDALLRRLESVKRDGLRIDARPGGRASARPVRDEAAEDGRPAVCHGAARRSSRSRGAATAPTS